MSLVITGNPGVGKHTIANEIMKNEDYDLLDINKIAIESNNKEKDEISFEVDVENLKKYMKNLLTSKSLIVGHLAPYVIEKSDFNVAIILRKNPYKLAEIYQIRKYSNEKAKENLGSEILGIIAHDTISKFGDEKTLQIDNTKLTPQETIKKIQLMIENGNNSDEVDWLSEIKQKNDLEKFFDY
jgi:adenylate kinase